jgi:hypothetical protein
MHIIECEKLLRALQPAIGRADALRLLLPGPGDAAYPLFTAHETPRFHVAAALFLYLPRDFPSYISVARRISETRPFRSPRGLKGRLLGGQDDLLQSSRMVLTPADIARGSGEQGHKAK